MPSTAPRRGEGGSPGVDVAIIGAGPYGLSLAAHLTERGVDFRIFGSPMETWRKEMPKGMRLKSEGFASSLYDPNSAFTLAHYCREKRIPYADFGTPVRLETFSSYGLEFQRRFVPSLEEKRVVSVEKSGAGLRLRLDDGEVLVASRVIVAVGISAYAYVPPELSAIPEEFVSHSSRHSTLERFKGRRVAVIGAGASALDLAALLHQAGAVPHVVARKPAICFHDPPSSRTRTWNERVRQPRTGIGPGWRTLFYTKAPQVFHHLPEWLRLEAVKRTLGPAPAWFVKCEVVGKVPFNLGVKIARAAVRNGRVTLELEDVGGVRRALEVDHVIAATGYRTDLGRLTLLAPALRAGIRCVNATPRLSASFESSVPGLYFAGPVAANSFGPMLRFAYGAGFVARRLSNHLARSASRHPATNDLALAFESAEANDAVGSS